MHDAPQLLFVHVAQVYECPGENPAYRDWARRLDAVTSGQNSAEFGESHQNQKGAKRHIFVWCRKAFGALPHRVSHVHHQKETHTHVCAYDSCVVFFGTNLAKQSNPTTTDCSVQQ